jgi:hypothetical protein
VDTWIDFFSPHFPSREAARAFVAPLEGLELDDPRHSAKVMMHQVQRLISIAEDLPQIRQGKESLQLMFLLICAENIAKMHAHYDDDGRSKEYVRRFFAQHVAANDQQTLERSFTTHDFQALALQQIVDALYGVRCDVVHEGNYWGFHFHDGRMAIQNHGPDMIVSIQLSAFRDIVVRGCISAVSTYAP